MWLSLIFSFSDIFTRNIFVAFYFFWDFSTMYVHSLNCEFVYAFEIIFFLDLLESLCGLDAVLLLL